MARVAGLEPATPGFGVRKSHYNLSLLTFNFPIISMVNPCFLIFTFHVLQTFYKDFGRSVEGL